MERLNVSSVKVITEPGVYLVGRQQVDEGELARFLADHEADRWETDTEIAAEKLVEVAGRLCYMSFRQPRPGGNAAYAGHILDVGHGSVLEHAVFNLIIAGVSRSFTHELVRHRAGFGYSQLSQRFVDESDCEFVVPPAFRGEVEAATQLIAKLGPQFGTARSVREYFDKHKWAERDYLNGVSKPTGIEQAGLRWLEAIEHAQEAYGDLSFYLTTREGISLPGGGKTESTARRKKAREAARSVLPNATETKVFVTANARALRHFIEMRADPAADHEIRNVALAVLRLLQVEAPNLFGDYEVYDLPDGGQAARTTHRKV